MNIISKEVSILVLLFLCLPMFISAEVFDQNPVNTYKPDTQVATSTTTDYKQASVQLASVQSSSVQSSPVLNTLPGNGSWQELGPAPINNPNSIAGWGTPPFSGRVTAIAVNGSNPQEIYVGGAQGGVWKSLNGGSTWIPLMDSQSSLAVGAITISPDNTTIYVGTGEPNHSGDSYYGSGLLKSTDGGNTWSILGATYFSNSAISSIVISKTNPQDIVVATTWAVFGNGYSTTQNSNGIGIFLSTNGGSTWSHTLSSSNNANVGYYGIASMVANATNPNILYAGDFYGSIWQSTDGGSTWSIYHSESSLGPNERVQVAVTPANDSLLYAVFTNSSYDIYGAFVYDMASGTTYTLNSLPKPTANQYGPCNGQCYYDLVLTVSPVDQYTIYIGTNSLYKTSDGGSTWSFLGGADWNGKLHPDQHALVISPANPNTIYSGNDGGIWSSSDAGSTWTNLNTNLGITQFSSISASPTNDVHLFGGVQDNACPIYTNNTGWTFANGGDGGATAFINDTAMICNYVGLTPYLSVDNGKTFTTITSGLNQNDPVEFYAPMAQDPSNLNILYLGSNQIYEINLASGTTWTPISGGSISAGTITSIAVAKSNSQVIYEGDNQGVVKVSTNGGSTWTQILSSTSLSAIGTAVAVTSVAVNPFNPSIVMVSFAVQNNADAIMYSGNQGSTWSTTGLTALQGVATDVISFNPVTGIPIIGTDRGVFYLNSTDNNWYKLGTGLPNVATFDFTFTASNYLVAATHGRGSWLNYLTPTMTLQSPANNSYQLAGTLVNVSITDPNGLATIQYYWDSNSPTQTTATTISTTLPLGTGQHILHVSARDAVGFWTNETYVINTLSSSPIISLPTTFTNSTQKQGNTLNVLISDSNSINTVYYNWNDSTNTTTTFANGGITVTFPSGTGIISLYVFASDSVGNYSYTTFYFMIDNSPPTITLTNFTNTTFFTLRNSLDVLISDTSPIQTVQYNWNGSSNITATLTNGKLIVPFPSTTGLELLHIYAEDSVGNWASKIYTFIVDNAVPVMQLPSTFTNTTLTSGSTLEFSISNSVSFKTIQYNWNGLTNTSLTISNGMISIALPSENGIVYLHVYIQDKYGKWTEITYAFTVQKTQTTTGGNNSSEKAVITSSTPGFEVLTLVGAVGIVFALKKRKY